MTKTKTKPAEKLEIATEDVMPNRMHSLRDRCVLVNIEATRFSNSTSDSEKKLEIHDESGAKLDMFSFSKKLLTKAVLTRVQQHYSRARDLMRVPKPAADGSIKYDPQRYCIGQWGNGQNLLLVGRLQDMIVAFNGHDAAMKAELAGLEPEWNQLLREAEEAAGELFDADKMPSFDDFKNSWKMKLHVTALPEYDPKITLDGMQLDDVITQVKDATAERLTEHLSSSWRGAAESMLTSLKYAAAVLGNDATTVSTLNGTKDARKSKRAVPVAETLFDNLNNQVRTARALAEAAGDEGLLKLADTVAATLGRCSAEELRKNPAQRKQLAGVAKSLVSQAETVVVSTKAEVNSALDDLAAFA